MTILPISLTIYLLFWITARLDEFLGTPIESLMGSHYFPGLGLLASLLVIYLFGLAVDHFLSDQILEWVENSILQIPFVKTLYGPLRDVTHLFGSQTNEKMKRVVLVELNPGTLVMGLVTRDQFVDLKLDQLNQHLAVFLPYSYGVGGFTVLVDKSKVQEIDIPVDKALQLSITAWVKADNKKISVP